jgi:hypothetical protein
MPAYLIVFLGAGLGGALRHGVNVAALRLLGSGFPYGTLTVNIVGSFVMGLLAVQAALHPGGPLARLRPRAEGGRAALAPLAHLHPVANAARLSHTSLNAGHPLRLIL